MTNQRPEVAKEWEATGSIPLLDVATASDDDIDELGEDLFQARRATFVIDVGWYPEADRGGSFLCRLVANGDWQNPLEAIRIKDGETAAGWVEVTMCRLGEQFGEPGEISDELVVTVAIPAVTAGLDSSVQQEGLLPVQSGSIVAELPARAAA